MRYGRQRPDIVSRVIQPREDLWTAPGQRIPTEAWIGPVIMRVRTNKRDTIARREDSVRTAPVEDIPIGISGLAKTRIYLGSP